MAADRRDDADSRPEASGAAEQCDRLRQRLSLLERAIQTIARTREPLPSLLAAIAEASIREFADACLVQLVDPGRSRLEALAVVDREPEVADRLRESLQAVDLTPGKSFLVAPVLATGQPLLVQPLEIEAVRSQLLPAHRGFLDRTRATSLVVAALAVDGQVLGLLWLVRRDRQAPAFDTDDVEFARVLAGHAAVAVQTARLLAELRNEVDERQKAQAAADLEKRRLSAVLDAIPAGVAIADAAGTVVLSNAATERIWRGRQPLDSIADYGRYPATWVATGKALAAEDWALARVLTTGKDSYDQLVHIERFDGTQGTILNFAAPIRDGQGQLVGGVCVYLDVTERQQQAKALADSEARFRFLVDFLPQFIWTSAADGTLDFLNQYGQNFLGVTLEDALGWCGSGPKGRDWLGCIHQDDQERADLAWQQAVQAGEEYRVEYRVRRQDGAYRWCTARALPMRQEGGRILAWYGSVVDVQEVKEAEEQASRARKAEDVARLAGGVAHEINNMMAVVLGYGGVLLESLAREDGRRADLQSILHAGERAAAIANHLLAYSGQQMVQPVTLVPSRLVYELAPLVRSLLGPEIELKVRAHPGAGSVRMDRGQFEQIVVQLARNAAEAMPKGGELTVEVDRAEFETGREPRHPETAVAPGYYVLLAVSDTGLGMDHETLVRMWDPFFTTRSRAEATGLGLSTVHGIVKQAGGYAWAYSEVGLGTTVKLYLPVAEAEPTALPLSVAEPAEPVVQGTVLFVEDELMLRKLGERLLEAYGFRPLMAASAEEALALVKRHGAAIDIVVTDLVMPGLTGRQLGERLAQMRPDLPVLYASGYTDDEVVRRGLLEPGKPFLAKPYGPSELVRRIRELLTERKGR